MLPGRQTGGHPGECLWFKKDAQAIMHADMAARPRSQWMSDKWDPVKAGAVDAAAFQRFDTKRAIECVRGKHIVVLGESTTRDLYYAFTSSLSLKPDRSFCMNLGPTKPICHRTTTGADNQTRVSFQFLGKSNNTREMDTTRHIVATQAPDAVFVYCGSLLHEPHLGHSRGSPVRYRPSRP